MSTKRLTRRSCCAIAVVACVLAIAASAFSADGQIKADIKSKSDNPCEYAFNEMVLKRTWKESGFFYGAFDIRIRTIEKEPIVISGTRDKTGFRVGNQRCHMNFEMPTDSGTNG